MYGSKLALGMVLVSALGVGCSRSSASTEQKQQKAAAAAPAPTPVAAAPAAADDSAFKAKQMFTSRCAVCHGTTGKGDGPGSAALNPKPRDYTNAEWQKTVTDEDIKNTILMGGAAVGKSPAMPASPDLQSKPEVLAELVKIVRSYSGK